VIGLVYKDDLSPAEILDPARARHWELINFPDSGGIHDGSTHNEYSTGSPAAGSELNPTV
jgi:hypothetical protein